MSRKSNVFFQFALGLVLLAANLFALNYLADEILVGERGLRFDLTEDLEYSLTSVTRQLVSELDEELTLIGYFSERTHPKLAPLVPAIRDMMEEYAALSGDRIRVEFGDPRDDEARETEAKQRFAVDPLPFSVSGKYENAIINTYFHIVVAYGDQYERYGPFDIIEVEPDASGTDVVVRLQNLEYHLTKAIKKVVYGFQSIEALFADLPESVAVVSWISPPEQLPEEAREIAQYLQTVCDELAEVSGGKFEYRAELPPLTGAEQESLYARTGVGPLTLGFFDPRTFYCGAVLRYGGEVEPLYLRELDSEAAVREALEASLRRLTPGFTKTIGVHRPQPEIPPEIAMQMGRRPEPADFEALVVSVRGNNAVEEVSLDGPVDPAVDVLWLLKPKELSEEQVFHVDQYLMRGGKVVLAVDRFELDVEGSRTGLRIREIENPALGKWLEHHGVTLGGELLLDDRNSPFIVPVMRQVGPLQVEEYVNIDYPWFVRASASSMAEHPAVARLESLTFYWATPLEIDEERTSELEVTRLVTTSPRAWTDPNENVDPSALAGDLQASDRWYTVPAQTSEKTLAVSLVGSFDSYFAEHAPPGEEEPAAEDAGADDGAEADGGDGEEADDVEEGEDAASPSDDAARRSVIRRSPPTRLVVVGDSEIFSEQFARMTRRPELEENLGFALNLVDWSLEDNDMIQIRSRGATARPLEAEPEARAWVEAVNYAAPLGLVVVLGLLQLAIRRGRRPMALSSASGERG